MPEAILDDISHRRYNPLRDSWVLVSPHRTKRPWQGAQEEPSKNVLPEYDEKVRETCQHIERCNGSPNTHTSAIYVPATKERKEMSTPSMTAHSSSSTTSQQCENNSQSMSFPKTMDVSQRPFATGRGSRTDSMGSSRVTITSRREHDRKMLRAHLFTETQSHFSRHDCNDHSARDRSVDGHIHLSHRPTLASRG